MNIQKISPKYDASKLSDPTLEDYIDVTRTRSKAGTSTTPSKCIKMNMLDDLTEILYQAH